jgi:hypothetical protein
MCELLEDYPLYERLAQPEADSLGAMRRAGSQRNDSPRQDGIAMASAQEMYAIRLNGRRKAQNRTA